MIHTTKNSDKGIPLKTRLEKFENKITNIQDFISNHKNIDSSEKELLSLSFETMLDFVNKKNGELI